MDGKKELWLDLTGFKKADMDKCLPTAFNLGYNAVMLDEQSLGEIDKFPSNVKVLIAANEKNKDIIMKSIKSHENRKFIVLFSGFDEKLNEFFKDVQKGVFISINDKESMEHSIRLSERYSPVIIDFKSETNIPLELILAYSQKNKSVICKKITNEEDGWIATMTMEMGSHAVLMRSIDIDSIIKLKSKVEELNYRNIGIQELKVVEIKHVGMGDRVCIDTISKLDEDEGMIIGSTSTGGILVSSETHFLPYMDLRPFRVNAGSIHSYILCANDTTKYLSELKAGDNVLVVNSKGRTRVVSVGRMKMEKRPILMIKAKSDAGEEVNVMVQDDWHIRIISQNGIVKNSVLLKENDIVLGYTMKSGRHLGVAIEETIIER